MDKRVSMPAFPVPAFPAQDQSGLQWSGMTLRDYFAAKAMQAMLATYGNTNTPAAISIVAYQCADAMLAERVK